LLDREIANLLRRVKTQDTRVSPQKGGSSWGAKRTEITINFKAGSEHRGSRSIAEETVWT
jgi:hypothetical protein